MGADNIFISSMGIGWWVRGRLAGPSAGMFCHIWTSHNHPIFSLIMCSDDTVQPHPFSYLGLTGGSLCNISENSLQKALWRSQPFAVWVFRILGRMCFSAASMPDGQSGPTRTGELATASLVVSSRVGGVLCPQLRAKRRAGTQQILVEFNPRFFNRKDVSNSLTLSS